MKRVKASMTEKIIEQKSDCTGCAACYSVCPVEAIQMEPDEEGFLYPKINREICIKCNRCLQICPKRICNLQNTQQKTTETKDRNEKGYAAYNKMEKERAISSSGGIFCALAQTILEEDGVIFGARFDKKFHVLHGKAETLEELVTLIGSKYVQSKIGDCFHEVKKFLAEGRKVLFAGTMCQVEGLYASLPEYLWRDLYCIDLICMGIPSPSVWESYKKVLSQKGTIQYINFKNKIKGWQRFHLHIRYKDKDIYKEGMRNAYMQTFFRGYNMRPSCFQCEYKKNARKSDITLADCWGIERFAADMNDNKGCSTVIIHTKKGQELFDRIKERLMIREISLENAIAGNQNYNKCHKKPILRRLFWKVYNICPYIAILVFGNTLWMSGKQFLKRIIQTVDRRKESSRVE